MQRVRLGKGLELSRIVYGMWRLGDDPDTSPARIEAKLEACLEQGITTVDQADIYCGYRAGALLGGCLKATPGLRDRLEIVTKCGIGAPAGRHAGRRVKHYDTSAAHIRASIDHSLRDMGLERIDLLLVHRPDPFMDHHETGAALDEAVRSGKVRAVGVSNFRPHDWTLLQSATKTPLVTNQIELSLAAHASFVNRYIAFLQERGVAPMAWSPLGGGSLVREATGPLAERLAAVAKANNVDVAAVAVAWLIAHPARILPVMGTNDPARIARLADAFSVAIDRETWFELYGAALGRDVA